MIFDKLTMKIINNEKKLIDLNNSESTAFAVDIITEYCVHNKTHIIQIVKSSIVALLLMIIMIFSWINMYKHQVVINMDYDLLVAIDHILLTICSIYALYYLISSGKITVLLVDVYNSINHLGSLSKLHKEINSIDPDELKTNKSKELFSQAINQVVNLSELKTAYLIADHLSYANEYVSFNRVRNFMNKLVVCYVALTSFLIYI